jgi:NAD(P)H-dependent FMN reductase
VHLAAIIGSVTPPGRLDAAVRAAVAFAGAQDGVTTDVVSLVDHRLPFADGRPLDGDAAAVVGRIASAGAVLIASPVYRASFTGALKNLLDLVPVEGLRNKPVGILAMGASPHHYLGVDWQLRSVLAWFGALVAPTSVYLEPPHFREGALADPAARQALTGLATTLIQMARAAPLPEDPRPLAAGRG